MSTEKALKKRILVIDDSDAMLRSLRTLLGERVEVTTATSLSEGCRLLSESRFDSVITDFDIGDGTGFEIIHFLDESGLDIPVILITAFGSKELALKTLRHHIFGYLEKPFEPSELCGLLDQALTKRTRGESEKKLADFGLRSGELFHELATPITLIDLHYAQLRKFLGDQQESPQVARSMEQIQSQLTRIKNILENNREKLKAEGPLLSAFPLEAVLETAKDQCTLKAERQGVQLTLEKKSQLRVTGDRERLLQVFVNLINNAIDAASLLKERWVKIQATFENDMIWIRVTDSGKGIPPEIQGRLFSPLFTTKKETGTGLGLSIASRIVKEHQGDLFYDPSSPNTQFVVRLPRA